MAYIEGIPIRDSIHTDFSTGVYVWEKYRRVLTGEYVSQGGETGPRASEFTNDIREYNRRVNTLTGAWDNADMLLTPYNAGFRYDGAGDFSRWTIDPLDLNPYLYFDASANVTLNGSAVASWSQPAGGSNQLSLTLVQTTASYQPEYNAGGGYIDFDGTEEKFTFDDDEGDPATVAQEGVLIVGTSNGCFVYAVDSDSVDEITALGWDKGYFQDLNLYGYVLLPISVTKTQVLGVIRYLVDKGAARNPTGSLQNYWAVRGDLVTPKFDGLDFSGVTSLNSAWYVSFITSFPAVNLSSATVLASAWRSSNIVSFGDVTFSTDPAVDINFHSAWRGCGSLTSFPALNLSRGTNFGYTWDACSSLTTFPAIDLTAGTQFDGAWNGCTSLTTMPAIALTACTNFHNAWKSCASLNSFLVTDMSSGTTFTATWQSCGSLVTMPAIPLTAGLLFNYAWYNCTSMTTFLATGLDSGTNFYAAWYQCSSLISFPLLDLSSGTDFSYAWLGCSAMESFLATGLDSGTNFTYAWKNCTSLTTFPAIALTAGTNFYGAWYGCASLASFPAVTFSTTTTFAIGNAWNGCTSLTSFPALNLSRATDCSGTWHNTRIVNFPALDLSSSTGFGWTFAAIPSMITFGACNMNAATTFQSAWENATALTTFSAGAFDDWNPASISTNCFNEAWNDCDDLTDQSVENILVSISESGQWATDDGTSSGTALAGNQIHIDAENVDINNLTAVTRAACTVIQSRGWEVVINRLIVNEYSMNFNGSNEYLDTGFQPDFINTNATLSYWCKMDNFLGTQILGCHNSKRFYCGFNSQTAGMGVQDTNNLGIGADLSSYVEVGKWHHICLVADGGTATYYLDGVARDTMSYTQSAATNPDTDFFIGATSLGGSATYYMAGKIDEVAIWDVALDADAVSAVYNSGQPINLSENSPWPTYYDNAVNLVSWWRMGDNDSGAGEVVTDAVNPILGSDKVVNGTFATDTDWTKETGWTISGGKAVATAAAVSYTISQQNETTLTLGKLYEAVFTISNYSEGTVYLRLGTRLYTETLFSSNGTHSLIVEATNVVGNAIGLVSNSASTTLDVDNFSVRELGGNAASCTNCPTFVVDTPPNYSNYALNLNGSNEYATSSADSTLENKSYSFWVKSTDTGSNIVFDHGSQLCGCFQFNYAAGMPILWMNGYYCYWADNPAQDDGNWHHHVVYFDLVITNCKWYVDGILQTQTSTYSHGGSCTSYTTGLRLGYSSFQGSFDEFAVFDGELTSAQINTIFNGGVPADLASLSPQNWWRMGEDDSGAGSTITDMGSEEEDLALINTTFIRSTPPIDDATYNYRSILFNGTDEYADCGTGLGDFLGDNYAGSLTFSMWFKSGVTSSDDGLFYIGTFAVANGEVDIHIDSNLIKYGLNNSSWTREVAFTDTASWHHLVCVYATGSETNSKMYLDGVAVGSTSGSFPASSAMDFAGLKTIIGAWTGTSWTFDGKIDEVAVWDSELTASQIVAIYNKGQPANLGIYNPTSWWRMGEGDDAGGTIISDLAFRTGSQLVINGTFETNADGWTADYDCTLSADAGRLKMVNSASYAICIARQAVTVEVGASYEVSVNLIHSAGTATELGFLLGTSTYGTQYYDSGAVTADTTITRYITATTTGLYLDVRNLGPASATAYFSNISVKRVGGNPATLVNEPTWSTDSP